jgi:hypothetical protein
MVLLPGRNRSTKVEESHLIPHILSLLWCAKFDQHGFDLEFRTSGKGVVRTLENIEYRSTTTDQ